MDSAFAIDIDPDVIARAKDGDKSAFKTIYEVFEKPVYSLAFRFCQNHATASDILQECMLQVFRSIHQFREEAPFWSWLRKIAVNQALMQIRRDKRDDQLEVLVDDQIDLSSIAARSAIERDLATAFAMLAPVRRAVLWLFAVEGYSHYEIAEATGYSESFSKSQVMRARRQLKNWWRRRGGGDLPVLDTDYDEHT